jgi:hypothetical protein
MENRYIKEHIHSKVYNLMQIKNIWWFSGKSNYIIHSDKMKSRILNYKSYGINIYIKRFNYILYVNKFQKNGYY